MRPDEIPDPTRVPCCECGHYRIVESDYGARDGCDRSRKPDEVQWWPTVGWARKQAADFTPNTEGHCPHRIPRRTFWQKLTGRKP